MLQLWTERGMKPWWVTSLGAWPETPSGSCLSWKHRFNVNVVLTTSWGLPGQDLMLWLRCQEPEREGRGRMGGEGRVGAGWTWDNLEEFGFVFIWTGPNWIREGEWSWWGKKKCRSRLHSFSYPTRPSVRHRSASVIWSVNERLKPATQIAVFLNFGNTKK